MSDFMHREQLENRLREELEQAERLLKSASPEQKPEARRRFEEALHRFSELVLKGKIPTQWKCA
jgi:hypothetical protein